MDSCYNGQDALDYLDSAEYDALILDIMMPVMDGLTVLKKLRSRGSSLPVLLLTAKDSVDDRVRGLDAGANDYLVKTFRLRRTVRPDPRTAEKARGSSKNRLEAGRSGGASGHPQSLPRRRGIRLSGKEFSLLRYMIQNQGIVLSRDKLEQHIWNYDYTGGL